MNKPNENLEQLLEELLVEDDPNVRPTSMADFEAAPQDVVSLDQMIDRYLVQYEREAIPTSEMFESANVEELTGYLFEQNEDEPPAPDEEEADAPAGAELDLGGLDTGADAGGGDEDPTAGLDLGGDTSATGGAEGEQQPPVVQKPKINLQDFARSVARLVNNLQSLIDLKTIVLNRAKRYIQNNYDERTAKEMMEILETSYDLKPEDVSTHHMQDTEFPQPRTGVTGPIGG